MLGCPSPSSPLSCSGNPPSSVLVNAKLVSSFGTVSLVILSEPFLMVLVKVHSTAVSGATTIAVGSVCPSVQANAVV